MVEFENSSWVVERGVRHTEWFVKLADKWVRVADVQGIDADPAIVGTAGEIDDEYIPPGCQYLRRFRVVLPLGTPVHRRVSSPRSTRRSSAPSTSKAVGADLKRDILSYFRYAKPPLAVVETHFRVARRGLVPEERWERAVAGRAQREIIRGP